MREFVRNQKYHKLTETSFIFFYILIIITLKYFFHVFFRYELSDGQIRSEEGAYKDSVDSQGNPVKILVVQGSYSFIANGTYKDFLLILSFFMILK